MLNGIKNIKRTFLIFLSLVCGILATVNAATLDVTVQDQSGQNLAGVQVVAVSFGLFGPDPANSRVSSTNASGVATFSGGNALTDGREYDILVSSHGWGPTLREQIFNPNKQFLQTPLAGGAITCSGNVYPCYFELRPKSNVGAVQVTITHSSSTAIQQLFADIKSKSSFEPVTFAMVRTTDTTSTFLIPNVTVQDASAETYEVGVFWPAENRGTGTRLSQLVTAGSVANVTLDFNNAIAPPRIEQAPPPPGSGAGELSIDGTVVVDSSSAAVKNAMIQADGFRNGQNGGFYQTFSDDNGYFAFYGLHSQTTYYFSVGASGYGADKNSDVWLSTAGAFFSGTALRHTFRLTPASGILSGHVLINGVPVPHAHVDVFPDFAPWNTTGVSTNPFVSNPGMGHGFTQATTGYFRITGLPDGNYKLMAHSEFSQQGTEFNAGANGQFDGGSRPAPEVTDDLRIAVESGVGRVYTSTGTLYSNEVNVVMKVSTATASGTISGKITFKVDSASVDLLSSPIVIIAHQAFFGPMGPSDGPPKAGFAVIKSSGAKEYNYTVQVPPGIRYILELKTPDWAMSRDRAEFDIVADLETSNTASNINFVLVPGGRITGEVRLPDGSIFKPRTQPDPNEFPVCQPPAPCTFFDFNTWYQTKFRQAFVHAHGMNVPSGNGSEVGDDGSFTIDGLLPGMYEVNVNGQGGGFTWANSRLENVTVNAGTSSVVRVTLKDGVVAIPRVLGNIPEEIFPIGGFGPGMEKETAEMRFVSVIGLPTGPIDQKALMMMAEMGPLNPDLMISRRMTFYDHDNNFQTPDISTYTWQTMMGGSVPRIPPGKYDFYLTSITRRGPVAGRVVLGSIKNTELHSGATMQYFAVERSSAIPLNITSQWSANTAATIAGSVAGQYIFRNDDFEGFKDDPEAMIDYVPLITLYDADGALRAVGNVAPSMDDITNIEAKIEQGTFSDFTNTLKQMSVTYRIPNVPAGSYTAVATTPNYPPVIKKVTLIAGSTTTTNFNFDTESSAGGSVVGVIRSTSSVAGISGASILVKSRSFEKKVTSNANGAYSVEGLPNGLYRIYVSASGYALAAAKKAVSGSQVTADFSLRTGPGSIAGTVYASKFPFPKMFPGAKIIAYDDTWNGLNPAEELPIYRTITGPDGTYSLSGLLTGDTYKIFCIVPGRFVLNTSTVATSGSITGVDFVLQTAPPSVVIRGMFDRQGDYNFFIESPKKLIANPTVHFNRGSTFGATTISTITVSASNVGNAWTGAISVSSITAGQDHMMHVISNDGAETKVTEVIINTIMKRRAHSKLDEFLADSGQVELDDTGQDPSLIDIPAGSLISGTTDQQIIPTMSFLQKSSATATEAQISPTSGEDLVSGVYSVELSSAQITGRKLELAFSYDKDEITDTTKLKVMRFNSSTNQWESVQGTVTADPVSGVLSVEVGSFASAQAPSPGKMAAPALGQALFDGKRFVPNPAAAASQSGTYAVFTAPQAPAYSGANLKTFCFPNPFNLKQKTLTLRDSATQSVRGALVAVALPSGSTGNVKLRIFNVAGELVREVDGGTGQAASYNYIEWDGKNKDGDDVASGVYFCLVRAPGAGDNTIVKMVVLK